MAANSLQTTPHHHHHNPTLFKPTSPPSTLSSSLFLKPTSSSSSSSSSTTLHAPTTTFSLSFSAAATSTTTTSSSQAITFDLLEQHLSAQNFRQADEETRRLLIVLAGEATQKRGYVFFSEVQFIPEADLKAIDELWKQYSNKKFGYSVQRRIWDNVNRDFSKFFLKVGWMKKLNTEVEQYNYRAFPNEFVWELNEETPEGHLPLTNALRGTQLLNSVLSHPVFQAEGEEEEDVEVGRSENGVKGLRDGSGKKPLNNTIFKPDYSF